MLARLVRPSPCSPSKTRPTLARKYPASILRQITYKCSLINILRGANQEVPEDLLKFGSTVKKKTHDMYGAFFKDVDMNAKSTKITFD